MGKAEFPFFSTPLGNVRTGKPGPRQQQQPQYLPNVVLQHVQRIEQHLTTLKATTNLHQEQIRQQLSQMAPPPTATPTPGRPDGEKPVPVASPIVVVTIVVPAAALGGTPVASHTASRASMVRETASPTRQT